MIKNILITISISLAFLLKSNAQSEPFQIAMEPMTITDLGGIHSFAWGQHNGKWLIIGGRLDGLHQRQPFAAFNVAGNNNQILVVDPVTKKKWSAPLASLPTGVQEQLSSTNMEFHQEGDFLYIIGGYGYSKTSGDHITFPNLSAVKVSDVIDAIINGEPYTSYFRQITDPEFAVTGGYLNKINNKFYLTGGQKFMGRYNPMGPNNGQGFVQEYTDASRKFTITDNGDSLSIKHFPAILDAINLHRRDYNVVPQIMPAGQEGLTAFSGVFQINADLPFLNCVNIDSSGHTVNNNFSQYYNHYHCAHIPLYSVSNNEMHTVFFGGIAQYYEKDGVLVQDNNVPFVKTIARVTRDATGKMTEYKLPIEMPALLGAGSEFIPVGSLPKYKNEVIKLDEITADTTLVGYIYGGISSTAANIFFTNTGTQSSANSQIFKVYIIKSAKVGIHELNTQSTSSLQMQVSPNPNRGTLFVKFNLIKSTKATITILDAHGKLIDETTLRDLQLGENTYSKKVKNLTNGGIYFITIETVHNKTTQKIIIEE